MSSIMQKCLFLRRGRHFIMEPIKRHIRPVPLGLVILFCLLLVPLEFSIPLSHSHITPLVGAKSVKIKVMPLGDSITYGSGSSNKGGYRFPLWNDLRVYGSPVDFVGSQQSGPAGFDRDHEG